MRLSICVITMNRAMQLKEALESCLACELPEKTEFIVIDNASADNTEEIVQDVLGNCGYPYYYERLSENIGAGAGRNYYFSKARGVSIYGMDDDAVIDFQTNPDFFIKAIDIMDRYTMIGSLATQVFDTAWNCNRQHISGAKFADGIFMCKMFCGGSHFLRKSFFTQPPYFANRYGYEELPPSLTVLDRGGINVFCPNLVAIHKPKIYKWDRLTEEGQHIYTADVAAPYAIRKMMYPNVFKPLLWCAVQVRFFKSLRKFPDARSRLRKEIKSICELYPIEDKLKCVTVLKLIKLFGFAAF